MRTFVYASRMSLRQLLRTSWMDFVSAAAFLAMWLFRDRFEYDTVRAWLFWPVVFQLYAALALSVAGMLNSIRSDAVRNLSFALVAAAYVFSAWLTGAIAHMPHVWITAVWLLIARLIPPTGLRFGEPRHRVWVRLSAGFSGLLWGAGFVLTMVLAMIFSSKPVPDANGELRSVAAIWIFPVVWTSYFLAEGLLHAWRKPPPHSR